MHQRWLLDLIHRALQGEPGAIGELVLFVLCVGLAWFAIKWWLDR